MLILSKHSKNITLQNKTTVNDSESSSQGNGELVLKKSSGAHVLAKKSQLKPSSPKVAEAKPIEAEYKKVEATLPVFPDPSMATAVALLNMNNTLLYTMIK